MNKWVWGTLGALAMMVAVASPAFAHDHGEGRKIVVEGFRADDSSMSLQLNLSGMSLSDDAMDVDGIAHVGGINLNWRWDLVEWGGLELGFGGYSRMSEDERVDESRTTMSLAWLWYFARHYHHRFYGITGFSSVVTTGTVDETPYSYSEGGLVLGLGSEWLVNRHWLVSMDLRTLLLSSDGEGNAEAVPSDPGFGAEVPVAWVSPPQERSAVMFNLGVGYRW